MSKARKYLVAAAAMTLLLVCAGAFFLHGQAEYVPPNQVAQEDAERSQVYLTGDGYTINKEQKKVHQKTEQKRQEIRKADPQKAEQTKPVRTVPSRKSATKPKRTVTPKPTAKKTRPQTTTTKGPEKTPSKEPEENKKKRPVIQADIANGEEVRGTRLDFTVIVTDYKGRDIPVFSENDGSFNVTCNGSRLSSSGSDGSGTSFRATLVEGDNQIVITAADREGNQNSKTIRFKGITSEKAEATGYVYVIIQAPVLGLDLIDQTTVELARGDTAKDVLEKALEQTGITGSFSGGYLSGISRSGISEGAFVSEELRLLMEERRQTEKDPDKQDRDRLKEHDFYDSSGWLYCVNGEFPEKGLNSYKMEDGDELILIFQLAEDIY